MIEGVKTVNLTGTDFKSFGAISVKQLNFAAAYFLNVTVIEVVLEDINVLQ